LLTRSLAIAFVRSSGFFCFYESHLPHFSARFQSREIKDQAMSQTFGGLQVLLNVTGITAGAVTKYTQGWSALVPTPHGALDVVPSVANSNLTLIEGNYMLDFNATIQQNGTSGISTAGVVEEITIQAYLDGVALAGALCVVTENELNAVQCVGFKLPINVAHGAAGVLDIRTSSTEVGGSDLTIRNANFVAVRMD
jgi:hypothetical protein